MASAASTGPALVRKAELARQLGVSRQAIGDLVKRGVLVEDKDGLIDVELARVALENRVRPSGKTALGLAGAPAAAAPAGDGGAAAPPPSPTYDLGITTANAAGSFQTARTLNEVAQAKMNQLKLREMEKDLIRVAAVEAAWASCLAAAREHLLQVRARLAPLLAAESDAFVIEQMLDEEHSQALQLLATVKLTTEAKA